jgi:lysyl-tRNA synthetase class 2
MSAEETRRLFRKKNNLVIRSRILAGIRDFFSVEGFLEVETPLRVPAIAPERFIIPYTSEGWFLSTSPELQMKRLLSAGYDKIFQICHCFRRDERGQFHNPEFSMLEWYRAGADYQEIIRDTERLVFYLTERSSSGSKLNYQGRLIDLTLPWPRLTVRDAYQQRAGWDPFDRFDAERFDMDMVEKIIPGFPFERPVIIMDYPSECASLARLKPGNTKVAERAEVFIAGLEIANGFSELNEATEQERRFRQEMQQMQLDGKPAVMPRNFLEAVKNLPDCAGNALGIDRLVMLYCDVSSIDEVAAFPDDLV